MSLLKALLVILFPPTVIVKVVKPELKIEKTELKNSFVAVEILSDDITNDCAVMVRELLRRKKIKIFEEFLAN